MSASISVGLAGITGKFGRLLASKLLQKPNVVLRGYARDPSKLPAALSSSPRVQLFKGDAFDDPAIKQFVSGCDVVASAYLEPENLMIDGQKKLIDACDDAGVPRYVASDWCLDYTKLKLGELFPKDPMIHPIFSPFYWVWDSDSRTLRYWGDGTEPWEGTTYADAAEYTATAIADTSAVGVKKFLGDRKTIKEIAASLKEVYGIEPKLENLGSLDDLKARMQGLRAESPAEVFMYYWINGQTFVGPDTDNGQYPEVKPQTWGGFMKGRRLEELPHAFFSLAE